MHLNTAKSSLLSVNQALTAVLLSTLIILSGCGLADAIQNVVDDVKNQVLNAALDSALKNAESKGGTAVLIEDLSLQAAAEITDESSPGFGAGIVIPAGAIDAGGATQVILSIIPIGGTDTAPRDNSYETVGPLIDFSLQPAQLNGSLAIKITQPARLTLPFTASSVLTGETALASRFESTASTPYFAILANQQIDTEKNRVSADTNHLSQYAAVAYRPLAPASIDGLDYGKMYVKVVSADTSVLCEGTYAGPGNYTLVYEAPTTANSDFGMLQLMGDPAPSSPYNFSLFLGNLNSFTQLSDPHNLKLLPTAGDPKIVDTHIDCGTDGVEYVFAYGDGDSVISRFEIIKVETGSVQTAVECDTNSGTICNIKSGTARLYWDVSATTTDPQNYPGLHGRSRGYVSLPYEWRERVQ